MRLLVNPTSIAVFRALQLVAFSRVPPRGCVRSLRNKVFRRAGSENGNPSFASRAVQLGCFTRTGVLHSAHARCPNRWLRHVSLPSAYSVPGARCRARHAWEGQFNGLPAARCDSLPRHDTRHSRIGSTVTQRGMPPTVSASAHDSKKCFSQGGGEHASQRKPTACGLHASTLCLLGERTQRPAHAAISRVRLSQRPASPIQPVPAQPAWPGCCHAPSSMQTRGGAAPSADQLWRLTGAGCAACDAGFSRQRSGSTPSCLGRLLPSCLSFI
jgi:hypothetical protein